MIIFRVNNKNNSIKNAYKEKLVTICLLITLFASPVLAETTKILPLGDSITANVKTKSYRYYLWNYLKKEGYDIDFVGSVKNQIYDNFDSDHEGHSGYRADEIASKLNGWLMKYNTPDIVLLHIGHNDFFQGQSVDSTLLDIGNIIDKLQSKNPKIIILVAQIIYPNWKHTKYTSLNERIIGLATGKTTSKSLVIPVNQNDGFNPATDTYDGAHPNESGNEKIAKKWFNAIVSVLQRSSVSTTKLPAPGKLKIISEQK